jgi:hypothetical protein
MKKAPKGSYKSLSFKGIAMRKNIYTHFFAFEYWIKKRGGSNILLKGIYTENYTGLLLWVT